MQQKPDVAELLPLVTTLAPERLGSATEAGLLQLSLPWPPAAPTVHGMNGAPAWVKPIGQWHGEAAPAPRRLLITADAPQGAPDQLRLDTAATAATSSPGPTPEAEMVLFDRSPEKYYVWECHYLRLSHGGKSMGLAMGLRHGGKVNWWHACRLVVEEESPFCKVVHMAGVIPVETPTMEEMNSYKTYANPYLHNHNWINGDIHARLYANGVVEIYARHVNAMFFDEGKSFEDLVPVIGLVSDNGAEPTPIDEATGSAVGTAWDGTTTRLRLGDVRFDLTDVARLATPEEPGDLRRQGDFLILQPYLGVCLYGGVMPAEVTGTPWHFEAAQKAFPRGMSRTLHFSFSLGDRSPRIARYLAPYWWYGANAELCAKPFLPVSNEWDPVFERFHTWARHAMVNGGFEDGAVPRGAPFSADKPLDELCEPGWDGDVPYGQFLTTYRLQSEVDYQAAMRSAYHQTDVVFNHASKMMNMHGYPPSLYSVPMNRPLGTLMAYLENGDPFLLSAAEALVERSWRTHLNSWPRLAIGRDACFLRGAVFLYRYFNNEHFRAIAREGCLHQAQTQRENGSFGDQGGGSGIHQWAGYISKPWMACLGTSPILDYLDLCPGDAPLEAAIRKTGDWLLKIRWQRDGIDGWSYQHDFVGADDWINMGAGTRMQLPTQPQWHDDHLARILGHCTIATGNPAYADAFMHSFATIGYLHSDKLGGHGYAATTVFLLWLQMHLWRAQWRNGQLETDPLDIGPMTPRDARIFTPRGIVDAGKPKAAAAG